MTKSGSSLEELTNEELDMEERELSEADNDEVETFEFSLEIVSLKD